MLIICTLILNKSFNVLHILLYSSTQTLLRYFNSELVFFILLIFLLSIIVLLIIRNRKSKKYYERELFERDEKNFFLTFAINHAKQAVVMIDESGDIIFQNSLSEEITNQLSNSNKNLKIWQLSSDITPESWPIYFKYLRENKQKTISSVLNMPDGKRFIERNAAFTFYKGKEYIITNAVDHTEFHNSELRLRQSEKIYRTILENIHDVVWIMDLELKTTYVTPSIERLTGYTVNEHLNQRIDERFTPESLSTVMQWFEYYNQKLKENIIDKKNFVLRGELEYLKKGGGSVWTEITVKLVFDEECSVTGIQGTSVNIEERKHAELELMASREKYKSIYENIIDVYYECYLDGILTEISPSFEKLSKYTRAEVIGTNIITFYKEPENRTALLQELTNKGRISNYEVAMIDKDGREVECSITSSILFNKEGVPIKICGTIRDVSERKIIEKIIRDSEERYKTLVGLLPITIAVSRNGKFIYINQSGLKMLGLPESENILEHELLKYIHPDDHSFVLNYFYKYDKSLGNTSFELRVVRNDGKILNAITTIQPIAYDNEPSMLILCQDITKQKLYEGELTNAKLKAEESDKLKTAFLANMSHEIRTPLNGIIGFAGLLNKSNLSKEKLLQYSQIINTSSHQLLGIINDIIDISKIEAGQMIVMNDTLNINTLLHDIYNVYKALAEKRGIVFLLNLTLPNSSAVVCTDELKLKQILNNLLNNALKFTHEGSIELSYQLNNNEIHFKVLDTGIGIPTEYQNVIFERFRQVEIANNRKYGGTGLGLSISKALVELLNGRIWLESSPKTGTTFYFTIPYSKDNDTVLPEKVEPNMESEYIWATKTILIAEDENTNYYFLEELLRDTHVRLLHAENGLEALNLFRVHKEIDLVLLDIKMPVLDGYKAVQEIKKINPEMPVIAQTAFAMSNDKDKALSHGFDDYIPKPIAKDDLLAIVNKYLFKKDK